MRQWLALTFLFAASCGGSPAFGHSQISDPDVRRRAANMPIMKSSELDGRKYRLLGEVGTSQCGGDNPNSGGPNVAAAHEVLRTKAAELGADAILDVACGDGGMTARCWTSFECRGDAIAWDG